MWLNHLGGHAPVANSFLGASETVYVFVVLPDAYERTCCFVFSWSRIAAQLPGRTDNEIKNYWNTRLKKKLRSQGLDPATHLPVDSSMNHSDDSGGDTETAECDEDSDTVLSDSVAVEHCSELPVNLEQEPVKVGKDEHSVAASGPSAVLEPQAEGDSTSQEGLVLSFKMEVLESPKSPRSTIPHCRSEEESEESSSTSTSKSVLDKESGRTESPARFVGEVEEKEGLKFGSSDSSINDVIAHQSHYCPMLLAASSQGLMQNLEEEAPWGGLQTLMSHTQSLDNLLVQEAASDYSAVFPGYGTYPHADISFPAWSMDGYMGNPASDSYPSWNFGSVHLPASHPSQELQRLAAILDQI